MMMMMLLVMILHRVGDWCDDADAVTADKMIEKKTLANNYSLIV